MGNGAAKTSPITDSDSLDIEDRPLRRTANGHDGTEPPGQNNLTRVAEVCDSQHTTGSRRRRASIDSCVSNYTTKSLHTTTTAVSMTERRRSSAASTYCKSSGMCSVDSEVTLRIFKDETDENRKELARNVEMWFRRRNTETLTGALAFVPWILQESYFENDFDETKTVLHRGDGAVVFSDASGFTALTERLAQKSNGAELLSQCLSAFFTPLIDLINAYRGDVIKFSGDALTIYYPAVDDTLIDVGALGLPPHGSFGLPDLGPKATAVLRASACCIEIHKKLHNFDTGVDRVTLCLHIGVGCGEVTILQVGGVVPPESHVPRWEYIIAGPPLEQIAIAEPLAKNGETCLSPQAWEFVHDCVREGPPLEAHPDFHLLEGLDEEKYTFPTVKYAAMEMDLRQEHQFKLSELGIIRKYVPSSVYKQIEVGTLTYVNEMRNISTIFLSGSGVDASTEEGAHIAQDLMSSVQRICYMYEGTLNKFVIDDKGMLFLLVYGLPPLVHTDDATRAVLCCLDMIHVFQRLNLVARMGVTTGRAYCGICGSAERMEYTVLGDPVNLSARLMANAAANSVLVDEETFKIAQKELVFEALPPIKVKGKSAVISIYGPSAKEIPEQIGLLADGSIFLPWYHRHKKPEGAPSQGVHGAHLGEEELQLCSIPNWDGIAKVKRLLGGKGKIDETGALHMKLVRTRVRRPSTKTVPSDSPFHRGGVLAIQGRRGMGKMELAEYVVLYSYSCLHMCPVFGSLGPRLGHEEQLVIELLRSTIGAFQYMDRDLPEDQLEALAQIMPESLSSALPRLNKVLSGSFDDEDIRGLLLVVVKDIMALWERLLRETSVLVVLMLEHGTSIFDKTLDGFSVFWEVVGLIWRLAEPKESRGSKTLTLMLLASQLPRSNPIIRRATREGWLVNLTGLHEESCIKYMAKYMNVAETAIPPALRQFVIKITLGNPLHIRETIDQLILHEHITVQPDHIDCQPDLEGINVSSWSRTDMIGETICLLESLDPLEAAVLKMATVFAGTFSLQDIASSSCPDWAGATYFDHIRLFRALRNLVKRDILRAATTDGAAVYDKGVKSYEAYVMHNVLIKKVGAGMVLEAQQKAVRRQALINRALASNLPARLAEVQAGKGKAHIPWYYENALVSKAY